jgi:hypothetical protein
MMPLRTLLAAASLAAIASSAAQAQTMIGGGKIAPSFPIVISQPGSYRLAANLAVPLGSVGIHVQAAGVTLDLNGFSITGQANCTGPYTAMVCSHGGNGYTGVLAGNGVTLRNGRVSGFTMAVQLGDDGIAEELMLEANSMYGLVMGHRGTARHVTAKYNWLGGVWMKNGMASHLHVSQSSRGVFMQGGMLQSSVVRETTFPFGTNGLPSAVRDSFLQGTDSAAPGISMGGNLCNLQPC